MLGYVTDEMRELRAAMDTHKVIIAAGGYGSGKTFAAGMAFDSWMMNDYANSLFGWAAKSDNQFANVLLRTYEEQFGAVPALELQRKAEHWAMPSLIGRPNRIVRILMTHSNSLVKLKGLNLQGLKGDEYSDWPDAAVTDFLLTRVRLPNSVMVLTTNPRDEGHWSFLEWLAEDSAQRKEVKLVTFPYDEQPRIGRQGEREALECVP